MDIFSRLPIVPRRLVALYLQDGRAAHCRGFSQTSICRASSKQYSKTLLLPKTHMPTRHKNPVMEEERLRRRTTSELYTWQSKLDSRPLFVLHDGPPYANGNLHMGHALNKILKDMINRYKLLRGYRIHYLPGWDCHGLPIEQKALASLSKDHTKLDPIEVRTIAKQEALKAIEVQRNEFLDLGVMADWGSHSQTYRTLDSDFEIRELELFQRMVEKGLVTYRKRPTFFSPASRTALAESELKYEEDHESTSVYVGFEVDTGSISPALKAALDEAAGAAGPGAKLKLAIWTTTPWSLPGNSGVAVNQEATYDLVMSNSKDILVIMQDRVADLRDKLGELEVLATAQGSDLLDSQYYHPFHTRTSTEPAPMVFHSDNVTSSSGTGLVHSAPAHGHDDYSDFQFLGRLPEELRSPIDDAGCFTASVAEWSDSPLARDLVGKPVLGEGSALMIKMLADDGHLLAQERYKHKYPYDWKSNTPVIVRATSQWFISLDHVKETAVKSLSDISFYPPQSRQRLQSFVESRAEWCISRQRSWGVPIPVLFDADHSPILDEKSLSHNISVLKDRGSDHWWTGPIEDFAGTRSGITRGRDTLDVWFDSGSSWTMLRDLTDGRYTADVCLEGSDQHRGWFQSQLITLLADDESRLPYRNLITHGMILDEKGQKMSKSAGNGLSPDEVIHGTKVKAGLGADTLRLWAASVDYQRDVSLGQSSLTHASETLRRLRSVCRFMLGSLEASTGPASGGVSLEENSLSLLDRYVLYEVSRTEQEVIAAYDEFAFSRALSHIATLATSTLSALYFDVIKDTLYCDPAESPPRQAILSVLQRALTSLIRMMAPIVPHLAEELHEARTGDTSSVFQDVWSPPPHDISPKIPDLIGPLLKVRSSVIALGESARESKVIAQLAETSVWIHGEGPRARETLDPLSSLPGFVPVSELHIGKLPKGARSFAGAEITHDDVRYQVWVVSSDRHQCPRCWNHRSGTMGDLCERCSKVVNVPGTF